jgi:hypothetical protein
VPNYPYLSGGGGWTELIGAIFPSVKGLEGSAKSYGKFCGKFLPQGTTYYCY